MTREEARQALADCRRQIDEIDRLIVHHLNQRARVVERIGRIKQEADLPVLEAEREEAVYRNVSSHNGGPLDPASIHRIFAVIMEQMRAIQEEMRQTER
jgi:chorismate mutase